MIADLASDLAAALDPVIFARRLGFEPDKWQAGLLRSSAPRVALNCCRQAGKSTVTALLALHTGIYEPGLILVLSPSQRQSQETFRKITDFYALTDMTARAETKLTLELVNGSRIVSLPGKEATIRGFSGVNLLIVDEAARVPDELYYAIRPMLAVSQGRIATLSTPFGKRGWWFQEWESSPEWERFEVPATKCPRISPEFLEQERRTLGAWWFAQEYECQFLDAQTAAFSYEDVQAAIKAERVEAWSL
ncbi:MAG: hypothetical protein BroJett018_55040 [Chloroflexota bacterium]|nr:MAG: hypothetical protein BroJett018_55040 [Chloroflexota bacterium]